MAVVPEVPTDHIDLRAQALDASVQLATGTGRAVLTLRGEFDAATAHLLAEAFDAALARRGDVEMDLNDVSFIDLHGLDAIVSGKQRLEREGRRLVLTGVPRILQRLVTLTHSEQLLAS